MNLGTIDVIQGAYDRVAANNMGAIILPMSYSANAGDTLTMNRVDANGDPTNNTLPVSVAYALDAYDGLSSGCSLVVVSVPA